MSILSKIDWEWLFVNPHLNSEEQETNNLVKLAISFGFMFKDIDLTQYAKNFDSRC